MTNPAVMPRVFRLLSLSVAIACVVENSYAGIDGLGVFEPAAAAWQFSDSPAAPSIDHTAAGFGLGGPFGTPTAGDWDGDGIDGVGIYAGTSHFNSNSAQDAATDLSISVLGYGLNMPTPPDNGIAGDWNGDGIDAVGMLGGNTTFFLNVGTSAAPTSQVFGYGLAADNPTWGIAGDWNGDGVDTVGFLDLDTETFYLADASPPTANLFVGNIAGVAVTGSKIPVAGDWDGDGIDSIGLFEPATDTWYLSNTVLVPAPVPGDYNGDGLANLVDYTVWRDNLGGDAAALSAGTRDESNSGPINEADYAYWKTNFGAGGGGPVSPNLDHTVTFGFGSSTQLPVVGVWSAPGNVAPIGVAVPEPSAWGMSLLFVTTSLIRRMRFTPRSVR